MASFRVTVSIRKESNNTPIVCKTDGQRFAQPKTIKLAADCKYRIDVNFRPARTLQAITVMERKLEVMDVSDKLEDTNSSAYSAQLHTDNVTPTKKGQRDSIPLTLQIQENYEFSTHLQGKWYKSASTQHCDWGTSVHAIEYECSVDQQNNCIKILKDTFR